MVLESPSPARGPWVPPGRYEVQVALAGQNLTTELTVLIDPRLDGVSQADLEAQFELAMKTCDRTSAANEAVLEIRRLKAELEMRGGAQPIVARLSAVEAQLYQVNNESPKDKIAFPIKLNDRLAGLLWNLQRADGRPNPAHYEVYEELSSELDVLLGELDDILTAVESSL